MKKLILLSLFIPVAGTYTASYAQKVPGNIRIAFKRKFPHARNINWGRESAHEYEAEFVNNGQKLSVNFKTNGKWVETEQDLSVGDLPSVIRNALKRDYPGTELKNAAHIWNPKGQQYEIDAEVKEKNIEFVYSPDGRLLSHSLIKDNDNGD